MSNYNEESSVYHRNYEHSRAEDNFSMQSEESILSTIDPTNLLNSTIDNFQVSTQKLTKSNVELTDRSSHILSAHDRNSVETTKSELIQRILDSLKPMPCCQCSSDNTTDVSAPSSIDESTDLNQMKISSSTNNIYLYFKDENELGAHPHIDDLLEKVNSTNRCSCDRIEICFSDRCLNQELSYKQKLSILRIILRRQQISDRYFSQSTSSTQIVS